jgi:DNA-binding NarL/FixJ family response regulator
VGEKGSAELTGREWEVIELMCEGLDTAEIAERLVVSPVTVRRHVSGILRKLGVKDRAGAVALVEGQI